jgi:hypothetical protein
VSELPSKPKRFQFSTRKLLLGTAVVAVWLGILRVLEVGPTLVALVTALFVGVGILRMALGRKVACLVSLLGVAVPAGGFAFVPFHAHIGSITLLVYSLYIGVVFGCSLFLIVELGFCFVDWADIRMRTKADE